MAINQEYYGSQETWSTAYPSTDGTAWAVKIPNFNSDDTTEVRRGCFGYKWGDEFSESGNYQVNTDLSYCYIAMDKDAPQVKATFESGYIPTSSAGTVGSPYSKFTVNPQNNVPFGWGLFSPTGGSTYAYTNGNLITTNNSQYWDNSPVNYKPTWYRPDWYPGTNLVGSHYRLNYTGWGVSPVLSWNFKTIKLVPVICAYPLRSGKTIEDLKALTTSSLFSDLNAIVDLSGSRDFDLKTYLNGSSGGVAFKESYPVIMAIGCLSVLLNFNEQGELTPATGWYNDKYMPIGRSNASANKGYWVPTYMGSDPIDFEIIRKTTSPYDEMEGAVIENPILLPYSQNCTSNRYVWTNNSQQYSQYYYSKFIVSGCVRGPFTYGWVQAMPTIIDAEKWNCLELNYGGGSRVVVAFNGIADFGGEQALTEYCRKIMAYFGMFFSDGVFNDVEETSTMDTQGLFLGIVDENGITHGTYSEGTENRNQPNYDWEDPVDDTPWTPGGGGDEGDLESDDEDFNPATRPDWNTNMESSGYNCYVITTPAIMKEITDNLMDPSLWDSFMNLLFNPVQCIVACHLMPANLSPPARGADTEYVYASVVKLTSEKVPIFDNVYTTYDVGTVDLKGYTKDFMDYNYTTVLINLPYVGMKELDIEACMDGSISVMYQSDALSGDCTATVWVKDRFGHSHYRYEFKGNCARRIPFGSYTSPIASGVMSIGKGVVQAAMAFLTGGLSDAGAAVTAAGGFSGMSGGWGTQISEFLASDFGRLSTINAIGKGVGTMGSGLSGLKGGATTGNNASGGAITSPVNTDCYLIIPRPKQSKPNNYLELDGIPSDKAGKVKDFTGYFAAKSVKFDGIGCTMDERSEIQQLLMAGIYLN